MSAALREMRHAVRMAASHRAPSALGVMGWLGAVLCLGLAVVMGIVAVKGDTQPAMFVRVALGFAGFWLAIVWVLLFVPGSVLMNSAANARLLPRQRRRLMQVSAFAWLACVFSLTVAFDNWGALLMAGFYLIALPLLMGGHQRAVFLMVLPGFWTWLRYHVPDLAATLAEPTPGVALCCALLLAGAAIALRVLYPNGGDAQIRMRDRQIERMAAFAGRGRGEVDGLGGIVGKPSRSVYAAALRRDCRRADPGTMLAHALGPMAHWSIWAGMMALTLAFGIGIGLLRAWGGLGHIDIAVGFVHAMLPSLAITILFCNAAVLQQMRRSQGEQALLRLTPLAGDASLLNRRLATHLLGGAVRNCAGLTLALLLTGAVAGVDRRHLLLLFALCCVASQVAMTGLLRDYAADTARGIVQLVRAGLLVALEIGVAAGLEASFGIPSTPLVIAFALGATAVTLRRDWRGMLAAPVAFPAGRLA